MEVWNELEVHVTTDDIEKYLSTKGIMLVDKDHSFIEAGTSEGVDTVVYYKGKEITNVSAIELAGPIMKFKKEEREVLNWRKEIGE